MFFIETRLGANDEQILLLASHLAALNAAVRKTFKEGQKKGSSLKSIEKDALACLWIDRQKLTSAQFKTICRKAAGEIAKAKAGLEVRKESLEKLLDSTEKQIIDTKRKLSSHVAEIEKSKAKWKSGQKQKKKKPARPDDKIFRQQAEKTRLLHLSLRSMAKRANRLGQKLAATEKRIEQQAASVVFGSRKLIGQRARIGEADSPFSNLEDWREEWTRKRDGKFLFDGDAHAPLKNCHAKYESGKLRIRLTEELARERLQEISATTGVPFEELAHSSKKKHSKCRTASEWLILDCPFQGQDEKLAQLNKFLEKNSSFPVSWRLSIEPIKRDAAWAGKSAKKGCAFPESLLGLQIIARAQAMDDKEPEIWASDKANGCFGVDINAFGISFCLSKPDGNFVGSKGKNKIAKIFEDRLQELDAAAGRQEDWFASVPGWQPEIRGDLILDWTGSTSKALAEIRRAAFFIVKQALWHRVPIALENLCFADKKARLRYERPKHAKMLSGFAYAKLIEAICSRAKKDKVQVIFVDPAFTSKLGYAKYGRKNGLNVDQAAALAIARKGLLSSPWFEIPKDLSADERKELARKRQTVRAKRNGEWIELATRKENIPSVFLVAAQIYSNLRNEGRIKASMPAKRFDFASVDKEAIDKAWNKINETKAAKPAKAKLNSLSSIAPDGSRAGGNSDAFRQSTEPQAGKESGSLSCLGVESLALSVLGASLGPNRSRWHLRLSSFERALASGDRQNRNKAFPSVGDRALQEESIPPGRTENSPSGSRIKLGREERENALKFLNQIW